MNDDLQVKVTPNGFRLSVGAGTVNLTPLAAAKLVLYLLPTLAPGILAIVNEATGQKPPLIQAVKTLPPLGGNG